VDECPVPTDKAPETCMLGQINTRGIARSTKAILSGHVITHLTDLASDSLDSPDILSVLRNGTITAELPH